MNGLVARVQRENNVDFNDHNASVVPASIPIGVIPAGKYFFIRHIIA